MFLSLSFSLFFPLNLFVHRKNTKQQEFSSRFPSYPSSLLPLQTKPWNPTTSASSSFLFPSSSPPPDQNIYHSYLHLQLHLDQSSKFSLSFCHSLNLTWWSFHSLMQVNKITHLKSLDLATNWFAFLSISFYSTLLPFPFTKNNTIRNHIKYYFIIYIYK